MDWSYPWKPAWRPDRPPPEEEEAAGWRPVEGRGREEENLWLSNQTLAWMRHGSCQPTNVLCLCVGVSCGRTRHVHGSTVRNRNTLRKFIQIRHRRCFVFDHIFMLKCQKSLWAWFLLAWYVTNAWKDSQMVWERTLVCKSQSIISHSTLIKLFKFGFLVDRWRIYATQPADCVCF